VGVGENAGGVNEGWALTVVGSDTGLEGVEHLVRLIVALVELAEVDVGLGRFAGGDGVAELCLCDGIFFLLFSDESEQAVGLSWEVRLHRRGEGPCFVDAAPDERWCGDVKLAEVAHGLNVFGIELNGVLEGYAHLDGEIESAEGIGVRGLESVGAAEPHLVVTAGGGVRDGQFALVNGVVAHVLGVVDAAEKLVGLGIARLRGEDLVECGSGFIDAALLEKGVGLGRIRQKNTDVEEE
jgi:hypothetical protein